jgi:hypothetical protein
MNIIKIKEEQGFEHVHGQCKIVTKPQLATSYHAGIAWYFIPKGSTIKNEVICTLKTKNSDHPTQMSYLTS